MSLISSHLRPHTPLRHKQSTVVSGMSQACTYRRWCNSRKDPCRTHRKTTPYNPASTVIPPHCTVGMFAVSRCWLHIMVSLSEQQRQMCSTFVWGGRKVPSPCLPCAACSFRNCSAAVQQTRHPPLPPPHPHPPCINLEMSRSTTKCANHIASRGKCYLSYP